MVDKQPTPRQRRGRRAAPATGKGPALLPVGGRLALLSDDELARVHAAALTLLAETGLAEAPDEAAALVTDAGGSLSPDGRLLFPPGLVEHVLGLLPREITLSGRRPGTELTLGGQQVHLGTGGASPQILDLDTGRYRDSALADIFDAARIVEAMDHIHFFSRPMVARDIEDMAAMELNTAWACLSGTSKHVMVSASSPESVDAIATLAHEIAGSEAAFRAAPFLSLNINHVAPPMRFDPDSARVLIHAARRGIPVMVNTFGQLGASSPVTIAGCVAQTTAETLAGMVLAWLAAPDVRAIFGPRPMVTDLRTGAMAAGAHFVTQAAGTQASLMATALESYVIDNDMLGSILSAHTAIEVSEETLNPAAIHDAATGAGHFLGEAETLARMNSDFLYPQIGDRRSIGEWQDDGAADSWQRAHARVRDILAAPPPAIIDAALAADLETRFGLRRFAGGGPHQSATQESSHG